MAHFVMPIDQGTTSTRAILFDATGHAVSVGQFEHRQHFPRPGYVENDANEIWRNTGRAITRARADAKVTAADIAAVGIANQRETIVVWDRRTGRPVHPAISWQNTRTNDLSTS